MKTLTTKVTYYILFYFISILILANCTVKQIKPTDTGIPGTGSKKEDLDLKRPKFKIAITKFVNKTKYGAQRLGTSASDILVTELAKTNRFILIERGNLDQIIKEQRFSLSDLFDETQNTIKIGRLLGVNAIITGSISQFGVHISSSDVIIGGSKKQTAEATVDVRVIDVNTGQIMLADSGRGVVSKKYSTFLGLGSHGGYDETLESDALRVAIQKFVSNIVSTLGMKEWYCFVADVAEDKIILDAGKESNLALGTKLAVYRRGKAIRSPSTGLLIGYTKRKIGVVEIEEYLGENGSIAKLISGSSPKKKDICCEIKVKLNKQRKREGTREEE